MGFYLFTQTILYSLTERNNAGFNKMVELDLRYIQYASLRYDFLIIWKTIMRIASS